MWHGIRTKLACWTLTRLLRKNAGDTIPRSLPAALGVDVYSIVAKKGADPWILVDELCATGELSGREWNGTRFDSTITVPLANLDWSDIEISHFFGIYDFTYRGIWSYLRFGATQYYRWQIALGGARQYVLARSKLARRDRIEILKYAIEREIGLPHRTFAASDLMSALHSPKWSQHPDGMRLRTYYDRLLGALVASGDLSRSGTADYTMTPKTMLKLGHFEEEERRHQDSVRVSRRLLFATWVLAAVGIAQLLSTCSGPKSGPLDKLTNLRQQATIDE